MAEVTWKILCRPVGDNGVTQKNKNKGGLGVYLSTGDDYHAQEVTRVAFERKNSTHPDIAFADQLREAIDTARAALTILREQLTWDGELQ